MKTPQSRIDDLVARPSEGLPVEIKAWIDPTSHEGIAKIVRACLAMRNQNGGFLIIGLNDRTLQVEPASPRTFAMPFMPTRFNSWSLAMGTKPSRLRSRLASATEWNSP